METAGTVDKAIEVLLHLHGHPEPRGVTAIGQALGLPKSSAHRLLTALRRHRLVERDDRGRYRLGVGLLALGLGVLEREPLVAAGRPVLEQEVQALGEPFFIVSARAGALIVLDKVEGTGFLRAAPQVGSEIPVHATAVGKLYLTLGPQQVTLPPALERFTPSTATTRTSLDRALERVRKQGYADNEQEWIEGLSVVAAPILLEDRLTGAVATAMASSRLSQLGKRMVAERAVAAARRIADRLTAPPSFRR